MIVAKPVGRGNWSRIELAIHGDRAQPLLVKIGDRFTMAGITWRICEVKP